MHPIPVHGLNLIYCMFTEHPNHSYTIIIFRLCHIKDWTPWKQESLLDNLDSCMAVWGNHIYASWKIHKANGQIAIGSKNCCHLVADNIEYLRMRKAGRCHHYGIIIYETEDKIIDMKLIRTDRTGPVLTKVNMGHFRTRQFKFFNLIRIDNQFVINDTYNRF